MRYVVQPTPRTTADLNGIYDSLSEYSEPAAERTCDLIKDGIRGLADFPRRYAIARESAGSSVEIRQLIVGNYRVLYQIVMGQVMVMRIVHASQETLRPMDLM